MSSAWNWVGIFLWLFLIAYVLWMINNVHSRKKRFIKVTLNNKKHGASADISSRNFMVTGVEVIILLVFLAGLGLTTHRHPVNNKNSIVSAKVMPLSWTQTKVDKKNPNAKTHKYLVMINRNRSRAYHQVYNYTADNKKTHSANSNSILINNMNQLKNNYNLPYRVQKLVDKKVKSSRSDQAWTLRIHTAYKNTLANGIGLHAGQKKNYYTVIYVPNGKKSGIYLNNKKLHKKAAKSSMR